MIVTIEVPFLNFLNVTYFPTTFLGIRKATAWYNSHLKLNRFPVRGQRPPKIPTIVLMTEDAANRQKAEKSGITSTSGLLPALTEFIVPFFMFFIVRKYVEGMVDSTQLLDLLAAVGSDDIEPTRAAAGRQVLYPDVRFSDYLFIFGLTL
jgi:exosome complex exonuclease DIS3/RRP44